MGYINSRQLRLLAQPLAKCFDPGRIQGRGGSDQNSYSGNSRRLLRLGEGGESEH